MRYGSDDILYAFRACFDVVQASPGLTNDLKNFILFGFEDPTEAFRHIYDQLFQSHKDLLLAISQDMIQAECCKLLHTFERTTSSKIQFVPKLVRFDICKYTAGKGLFEAIDLDRVCQKAEPDEDDNEVICMG